MTHATLTPSPEEMTMTHDQINDIGTNGVTDYDNCVLVTERVYNAQLDSYLDVNFSDARADVDGFDDLLQADEAMARAAYARGTSRAVGEYVANYWETPASERPDGANPEFFIGKGAALLVS